MWLFEIENFCRGAGEPLLKLCFENTDTVKSFLLYFFSYATDVREKTQKFWAKIPQKAKSS